MATLKTPITQSDHVRGPAHAPITLVEYGDYECPHCALAYPVVNQVQLHFQGRMRFVFRNFFPLTEVHPHAEIAAESAEFAGAAGLFWEMHDALFENQSRLSIATIFLIGAALGLPEQPYGMLLRRAYTETKCAAILWVAYAAASTAHRPSLSTVCGMTMLTIAPRWCRASRCASPPTRAHNGFAKKPVRSM
jgi:hypothetical protein